MNMVMVMRMVMLLVMGVRGEDELDRVIDIVYNPSAGPFQDTSESFYNPGPDRVRSAKKNGKSFIPKEKFVFPDRLDINKLSKYGEQRKKLSSRTKKAKLLRNGKKIDVEGGLDFGQAVFDASMGKRCILKREEIETVEKAPLLVCTHR